jgi:hypothetical protein
VGVQAGGPSSSRAHGRRFTSTYPPTPNTTAGIIINIANTVLIIVFSIPLSLLSGAGSWLSGGGRGDPELNDYVGSAGTAVTIAQRVIFRTRSVYT